MSYADDRTNKETATSYASELLFAADHKFTTNKTTTQRMDDLDHGADFPIVLFS